MEARFARVALLAAALLSCGANWRSNNFIVVQAPSEDVAREIVSQAETYRRELAIQWLGQELPRWRDPCPIAATVGPNVGAGGKTSFLFTGGVPYGWQMEIYGTRERVLDSVLPHEILHTIFATHFGGPLPRWADEGACTTVEHHSERSKQEHNLIHYLKNERGIPFNKMFAMREYPRDMLPLYAQGYSVTRYLVAKGGERKFVEFVGEGLQRGNWTDATQRHYGFASLSELQNQWLEWVKQGSPRLQGQPPQNEFDARQQLADSDPTSIQSQLARTRGGRSPGVQSPPPQMPSSFAAADAPVEPSHVARPPSGGWYKRQRAQPDAEAQPPARDGNATAADERRPPAANLSSPPPIVRGQEPEAFPPPEHQGRADDARAVPGDELVPLKPLRRSPAVASAPAAPRRVLLEWTRPKDRPWNGAAAEVALRSEPRASAMRPERQPEYFDAPLAEGTILR